MAKGNNQKLKLYYLTKIFREKTDEEHGLSMAEIIQELDKYGVSAERKSVYDDMITLNDAGIEIIGIKTGKNYYYHLATRRYELPELKLLVDCIQSSKFISARKSKELISKIESNASIFQAKQLQRQVYVANRVKTMNESVYYAIDAIHEAIADNKKVAFKYFQWNEKKEATLRKEGAFYKVSPWALTWDDEYYYLIAFDSEANMIKHYRVDKMLKISSVDEPREGKKLFKSFDLASYMKKRFSMFDGPETTVRFELDNSMAGVMIDRFGRDLTFIPKGKKKSSVSVEVAVSNSFICWVFSLGDKVKIVSPPEVVNMVKDKIEELNNQYK